MSQEQQKQSILIIDDEQDLLEILNMTIEVLYPHYHIDLACSLEQAKALLEINQYKLILSDLNLGDGMGTDLLDHAKSVFVISTGGDIEDSETRNKFKDHHPKNAILNKPFLEEDIRNVLDPILVDVETIREDGYHDIPLDILKKYDQFELDLFIEISTKKLHVYRGNDTNLGEIVEKYSKKGVNFFVATDEQYENYLRSKINTLFEMTSNLTDDQFKAVNKLMEVYSYDLKNLGFKDEVILASEQVITKTIQSLSSKPSFKDYLDSLLQEDSFRLKHSMLMVYLCNSIYNTFSLEIFPSIDEFSFAAFTMDISLKDDILSKINSTYDAEFSKLEGEKRVKYLNHPRESLEQLEALYSPEPLNPLIKEMILNQHERPLKKGFPSGNSVENLAEYIQAFTLIHEYAHFLVLNGVEQDAVQKVNAHINASFHSDFFHSILENLTILIEDRCA